METKATVKRVTIYGLAMVGGKIHEFAETRCPINQPGRHVATGRAWPETKRGWADAHKANAAINAAAVIETVDASEMLPRLSAQDMHADMMAMREVAA